MPEKKEARAGNKTAAQKQTQNGGGKGGGGSSAEDSEKLSWFESKVLKPVNDALG